MTSVSLNKVWKAANALHVSLYRKSDGKFANRIANLPILLITTYGRKSGKAHTNPLVYIKDGADYVVSATNNGASVDPGWYRNLQARPEAKIELGDAAFDARVVIANEPERTQLYEKFKAASSNFVKYEKRAQRTLPVIRLKPTH